MDGDGKADVRAQIGPAMHGTALRDTLDFVDFNAFTNQIDFAQFGKSFNTYAERERAVEAAARGARTASSVKLLGAYVPAAGSDLPADDAGGGRDRAGAMSSDRAESS